MESIIVQNWAEAWAAVLALTRGRHLFGVGGFDVGTYCPAPFMVDYAGEIGHRKGYQVWACKNSRISCLVAEIHLD